MPRPGTKAYNSAIFTVINKFDHIIKNKTSVKKLRQSNKEDEQSW